MKCAFCGAEYDEKEARKSCASCPLRGCGLLRCPRCGYETPPPPRWLKWFKREKKDAE